MKRVDTHQHLWDLRQFPYSWCAGIPALNRSFGWDRVVWGGDWPAGTLTTMLKRWADASDELFSTASPIEREKVFYKNAERIYRV